MSNLKPGVCAIKEEFIAKKPYNTNDNDNESKCDTFRKRCFIDSFLTETGELEKKKFKSNECDFDSKPKNKNKGQNKARPKTFRDQTKNKPCPSIVNVTSVDEQKLCEFANCKYMHDFLEYIKTKPKNISDVCHVFETRGSCPRGIACRFGTHHITPEGFNIVNEHKFSQWKDDTRNTLQNSTKILLQKKKYDFNSTENFVKTIMDKRNNQKNCNTPEVVTQDNNTLETKKEQQINSGAITDEDLIKLLPREKKSIDWRDKLYLSPLTTVGNLPFRRICKQYGADITCGEMALCESLLKGLKQEWVLVKRHDSEDLFGAQICGSNAYTISKTIQLLKENTELDFIDLNLGCPIDLIYKKGGGSGMMHRLTALETSVRCASKLLHIPFTVKMRTGVYQDKKIAHTIVPKMAEWGTSLITVHGRSREARYTRLADWEYIETCAQAAAPCPIFGNGDILSFADYVEKREKAPTVQGVMIGRGALIKPWIFTEIKEQKIWDICSSERFDILKKYTNYGLEHWGSDVQGVENTRRFMLEWLSFLYRYVPVGILERPPQKINERPPTYFGRDDLETLMASGSCSDWIKISEMLLGPVPDGFKFLPKHKANSY